MIKYLYVLTSDAQDYYLEQTLLSMTSMRMIMPDAHIVLLVDNHTEKTLTDKRKAVIEIANEFKSVTIDEKYNKKARSRWLKTSMRQHIEGDFLYIDGDTIIAEDLSSLAEMDIEIGAVLDAHTNVADNEKYYPTRIKNLRKSCVRLELKNCFDLGVYFNGGIIFCRDSAKGHEFFKEWHRLWNQCFDIGSLKDQQSLNQSNYNFGGVVKALDGIWNCQIMDDGALRYLHNAKIIHYFSSRVGEKAYIPSNDDFVDAIKKTGVIGQEIMDMLKNPKALFVPNTRLMLMERSLQGFYDSALCGAARRIYQTKMGVIFEFIFSKIKRYIFTPLRKKLFTRRK